MPILNIPTQTPKVILGKERLRQTKGFWSSKEILISQEEEPTIHLLNVKASTSDLIQVIWSHLSAMFRDVVIADYRRRMEAYEAGRPSSMYTPNFRFTGVRTIDRPEFYTKTTYAPGWPGIIPTLRAKGKTDDEIHSFLADAWLEEYRDNPLLGMRAGSSGIREEAYYLIEWNKLDHSLPPEDFLKSLWVVADLYSAPERFLDKKAEVRFLFMESSYETIISKLTDDEWQALDHLGASHYLKNGYIFQNVKMFFNLPKAASYAMALLLEEEQIIINPLSTGSGISNRLPEACNRRGLFSIYEVEGSSRRKVLPIITSTTVCKIEDIPEDLPLHLSYISGLSYHSVLRKVLIKYPADEKGYKRIDLKHFSPFRSRKDRERVEGSPAWFRAQGYGDEWVEFSEIYVNATKSGETQKQRELKRFASWACPRFKSPWDIKPIDLRDPQEPNNQDTWFAFIRDRWEKSNGNWSSAAKLFRVVANQLNIPGYPGYRKGVVRKSPFKNIANPFVQVNRKGNKTHRSRISSVLHDRLIDVLLCPDENGKPTFRWARESSRKHFSRGDFTAEGDWCPSRWTALAFLLLLPPRKKNVRWLDQGLMDETIFDPETYTMVDNTHKLRDYRYEDGLSHLQKYGRPSGVVQPITDTFMGKSDYLGLFISTNKTQLWNPRKRNGFEVPWPDGSELLAADDPEVQEHGRWLRQVYEVLAFQLKYVQKHDPYPTPVTFYDVGEDRGSIPHDPDILQAMPHFVPLFRDYRERVTIRRGDAVDYACFPIPGDKIEGAFKVLCREVETLLREEGFQSATLTEPIETKIGLAATEGTLSSYRSKFDIHSLRVAGISRLIEMDIDPTIVQEFVAGHLTPAMTHRYLKVQPWHVREKIIEALVSGNLKSAMDTWAENVAKGQGKETKDFSLVSAPRFREHVDYLPEDFTSITPINGGLCIMGGMGDACQEGGLYERENRDKSRKKNKVDTIIEAGAVQGGCGNCRFFRTAPFLIVEQSFYLDSIMDELRAMARQRKNLRAKITDFDIQAADCADAKTKHALENKRSAHKARLEGVNQTMVPMITEWVNRYLMLQDCQKQIAEHAGDRSELTLVSVFDSSIELTANDLSIEHVNTTDLGLVGQIVEKARMLEGRGIAIPEDKARMLQRSVDVILRSTDSPYLLLDVDEEQVGRAASIFYNFLDWEFGAEAIEKAAKRQAPLPLDHFKKKQINNLVKAIVTTSNKGTLSIESIIDSTDSLVLTEEDGI